MAIPREARSKVLLLGGAAAALLAVGFIAVAVSSAFLVSDILSAQAHRRDVWRQGMAEADMRRIAAYCHLFEKNNQHFPSIQGAQPGVFTLAKADALKEVMVAEESRALCPTRDPWGHDYIYGVNDAASVFALFCYGSAGRKSASPVPDEHVGTHCFEDTIIWLQDGFIQEPAGEQRHCG